MRSEKLEVRNRKKGKVKKSYQIWYTQLGMV